MELSRRQRPVLHRGDEALEAEWRSAKRVRRRATALFVLSLGIVGLLRQEFIPSQDMSRFGMRFQTPVGSSLDTTERVFRKGGARPGDVLVLARLFLARSSRRYGKSGLRFSDEALARLQAHHWPGNVRELANVVEQCVMLAVDPVIEADDLALPVPLDSAFAGLEPLSAEAAPTSLPETERRLLLNALERNRWNVTQAARALGISRDTLRYRIDKFGLRP